ncbi:MAG: hypothetical protein MI864_15775 [Pseudomonadales bacterium]|nr:hypothetical protein [Pseudomonadales bacterium]
MPTNPFQACPVRLHPSRAIIVFCIALALSQLYVIYRANLPNLGMVLLALATLVIARYMILRYGLLLHPRSVVRIKPDIAAASKLGLPVEKGVFLNVTLKNEKTFRARAKPTSLVHPWLTIIVLDIDNYHLPLFAILTYDNVHSDHFRRLRVALRFSSG